MAQLTRAEVADFLRAGDNYLILTHRRPDGDTLGSAAVLCRMLRAMGKTAHILENPELSPKYRELHQGLTVAAAGETDTVITVDLASTSLFPDSFRPLQDRVSLRIDHHAAEPYAAKELVDSGAGACGEILYDIMQILGLTLDIPTALALYTAVSTDTGCFRYANTTAHSFLTAAACAETGADLAAVNLAIFDTNSLAKLRIQGWLVENATFLANGQIAICALPLAVEREMGVTEDDMENISGFPRSIAGVKIAATLRENQGGGVKLSVRAVPGYNAADICAAFGGGGHKGAAGATIQLPLAEAAKAVAAAMPELERL